MTPHSQLAGQQLSEKDLLNVMEELADVRAKWYNIGLGLGLSVGTLDGIKADHSNTSDCLREALKTWLKTHLPPPTWSKVVDALRTKTVDEARLAAHLEHTYCSPKPVSSVPVQQTTTTQPLVTTPSSQYSELPPSSTLDCPIPSPKVPATTQPATVTTPPHHTLQEHTGMLSSNKLPPAIVTTPPDFSQPVIAHTLSMKLWTYLCLVLVFSSTL